ncbi:EF-hand domain-containing protein [Stenotrophomonas maltophilia]|nr:EF-hand domain-containing protein [Stenotrophomonas maltophilia]
MTIRNRKPLIALIVAAGSVLAIPAMAQSAKQQAAQAQNEAAQAQQAAAQAGQAADQATNAAAAAAASAQANGGGQTWASIDTDGNGTISKTEAQVNAGLAQVFDQADTNKDGELSADEYKAYVAAQQAGAGGAAQGAQGR